jgi:HK97 family phage major capsid protein
MDLKSELAGIQTRLSTIINSAKAAGRDLTEAEIAEVETASARATELKAALERGEKSAQLISSLSGAGQVTDIHGDVTGSGSRKGYINFTPSGVKAIAQNIAKPGIKALVAGGSTAVATPLETAPIPMGGQVTGFLSLFKATQRPTGNYSYLRQTVRTNNAAVVAPGAVKPTSVFTVEEVDGSLQVFAHLSEYVDKFLLEDNDDLERFLANELTNGVIRKVEAEAIATILGTDGTQSVTGGTSLLDNIYSGVTKLGNAGYAPSLIVINSDDYEDARLLKDGDGNYIGGNPFAGVGDLQLWSTNTWRTPSIPAGTALIMDASAVEVSTDRQGIRTDVDAATGFDRNQVRFRTEGRFALDVKQPDAVVEVTYTAA